MTLLKAGINVYVEKPLATSLEDANRIVDAAREGNAIIQCGFQERYILTRLHLDTDVKPIRIECRRLSPWTGRGADVDVALDFMIHDIDMVIQLAGTELTSSAYGSVDELSAVLHFTGCTAHLHASRRAVRTERTMLLVYEDGTVYIDFLAGKIHDSRPITLKARFGDLEGASGTKYDPLGVAISEFVSCVKTGSKPSITGDSGLKTLAVTLGLCSQACLPGGQLYHPSRTQAIPLFDVKTAVTRCRADLNSRIANVLEHGQYIDGPEVAELETKLARFVGAKHCLSVSSGTTALTIAIMGEGLSKQDAVFIPALTYNATCNAVLTAGATPVFVDVDRLTFNVSAETLRAAIRAVMKEGSLRPAMVCAVDLYGKPAPYADLNAVAKDYDMIVLADAAQSFGGALAGIRVGNLTDMTATSFYPSKTLGGLGDGGALFTNDTARYKIWQSVRWHGTDAEKRETVRVGMNGRLSSIQCAMLLAKFKSFEQDISLRGVVASYYQARLAGHVAMQSRGSEEIHANGLFTVLLSSAWERQTVAEALRTRQIGCGVYYPKPLPRHSAFTSYVLQHQSFPNTDWLADRLLSLPMSPYLDEEQVTHVCRALLDALKATSAQEQSARL